MDYRATWCTFQPLPQNLLYFCKKVFLIYFEKSNFLAPGLKNFLYFFKKRFSYYLGTETLLCFLKKKLFLRSRKISYIFSKKNFCFCFVLIFQEGTFLAQKIKKGHSEIFFYISGNGTF